MIFFVTNHDAPTRSNFLVSEMIGHASDEKFVSEKATRENLLGALGGGTSSAIFSMSHGRDFAIVDNLSDEAIGKGDGPMLKGFKVFAWACLTGRALGPLISKDDAVWWGYNAAVTAPVDDLRYIKVISKIFEVAKNNFSQANNESEIKEVLDLIFEACQNAIEELDSLGAQHDENCMEIYSTCRQFWLNLCVSCEGGKLQIQHPQAPKPILNF